MIGNADAYRILTAKTSRALRRISCEPPALSRVKVPGFMLPSRYEPPTTVNRRVISANPRARLFTAGRVEPDADTVIPRRRSPPNRLSKVRRGRWY